MQFQVGISELVIDIVILIIQHLTEDTDVVMVQYSVMIHCYSIQMVGRF